MTSEERHEARYQRRFKQRQEKRDARSNARGDFEEVFSFKHLYLAGKKCCKGVMWKNSTQRYLSNIIVNTSISHQNLMNGIYRSRGFHEFDIYERGKPRHIRSVHISERVIQKTLCDNILVPVFAPALIYDNGASLKGKGMDFSLNRMNCHLERHYRKHGTKGGILLYDFSSFFDSAPHEPIQKELNRRIHDDRTRAIATSFMTDFGEVGLGLGSQVSQTDALMLPNALDHYCKEVLCIKGYGRYMDDGYLIHEDIRYLRECLEKIKAKCLEIGVRLNVKKTRIIPLSRGFKYLKTKFILTETGQVVRKMNRLSATTMCKKLKTFKRWLDEGKFTLSDIRTGYESWKGHMKRGNSFRVLQKTNDYFKTLFGFYPDKKGWLCHV